MKKFAMVLLVLIIGGVSNYASAQKKDRAIVCFKSDMDCSNCEKTLFEHLKYEKGVKDLKVDHSSNTIYIEFADNKNNEKGLAGAIENKGYKAEKIDQGTYNKLVLNAKENGHQHHQEVHTERK